MYVPKYIKEGRGFAAARVGVRRGPFPTETVAFELTTVLHKQPASSSPPRCLWLRSYLDSNTYEKTVAVKVAGGWLFPLHNWVRPARTLLFSREHCCYGARMRTRPLKLNTRMLSPRY